MKTFRIEPGERIYEQKGAWVRLTALELAFLDRWYARMAQDPSFRQEDKDLHEKLTEAKYGLRDAS